MNMFFLVLYYIRKNMKFSRKYTRKNKRNGKTKKSKKGGEYMPKGSTFGVDSKSRRRSRPRTPTPPHNRINRRTPPRRTPPRTNTNTRPQDNRVRDQANGIEWLLNATR